MKILGGQKSEHPRQMREREMSLIELELITKIKEDNVGKDKPRAGGDF